jgi:hypothetical protein
MECSQIDEWIETMNMHAERINADLLGFIKA